MPNILINDYKANGNKSWCFVTNRAMETLTVIGMTLESYDQTYYEIVNFKAIKKTRTAIRYYLYGENISNSTFHRILLDEDYDSEDGWNGDSFGIMKMESIDCIPKLSYVPIDESIISADLNTDFFHCSLFTFSRTGGV